MNLKQNKRENIIERKLFEIKKNYMPAKEKKRFLG